MPWIIAGVFAFIAVCLASVLVYELQKKNNTAPTVRSTENDASRNVSPQEESQKKADESIADTDDSKAITVLCKEFYNALNNRDANALHKLLSPSCQKRLSVEDMGKRISDDGQAKYEFIRLEGLKYENSTLGMAAMAKVKRTFQRPLTSTEEGWRNFKFIKESGDWRMFRDEDLIAKMTREFKGAFTDEINAEVQLLRNGDPFDIWDKNNTNVFEQAFKITEGRPGVFPWNLEFKVESNRIDGYSVSLTYVVSNKSLAAWDSPLFEFELKQNGKTISTCNDSLPNVLAVTQIERNISFFLSSEPRQTTAYNLDVYCSIGFQRSIPIVRNVPIELKVQKASELAKLEIISTQFDATTSENFTSMLSARINYRVKNISKEPIQRLDIKCVWFDAQSGEQLDQSTEYVVGFGDVPLEVGKFKTGFIRCGKGYAGRRAPIKADVYLESGEKRSVVISGLLIK